MESTIESLIRAGSLLAEAEAGSDSLPDPEAGTFEVAGRQAIRLDRSGGKLDLPIELGEPITSDGHCLELPTAADALRLGKYTSTTAARARGFYVRDQSRLTAKVFAGPPNLLSRLDAEADLRRRHRLRPPLKAPEVIEAGSGSGSAYLVEEMTGGHHPASPEEKQEVAERIVGPLIESYLAWGVSHVELDRLFNASMAERLSRLSQDRRFPTVGRMLQPTLPTLEQVLARRGRMATAVGHGDLVFTNVVVDPSGAITLLDWEHAHDMPIAADLLKLLAGVPERGSLLDSIEQAAAGTRLTKGRRLLPLRYQLGLAALQSVSWWETRLAAAEAAGRFHDLATSLGIRADLAAELLGV